MLWGQAAAADANGDVVAGLLRDIFGKEQACTSGRGTSADQGEDAGKVRLRSSRAPCTIPLDRENSNSDTKNEA